MHRHCYGGMSKWNVLTRPESWLSFSIELVRMVMNGWGSRILHTLTLFTCYCSVCIFFFSLILWFHPCRPTSSVCCCFLSLFHLKKVPFCLVWSSPRLLDSNQQHSLYRSCICFIPFSLLSLFCVLTFLEMRKVNKKKFQCCTCKDFWIENVKGKKEPYTSTDNIRTNRT